MRRAALCMLALPLVVFGDVKPRLDPTVAAPPVAPIKPHKYSLHGDSIVDNYYWIKDKSNPETIKYIEAENAYGEAVMKPLKPFEESLYKEMLARIKQTDLSVPYQHRGWWYYSRTEEGKQYNIRCRKLESLGAKEEILVDGNELAKGQKFMSLAGTRISDDGWKMVYPVDFTGFREYHLYVKDLKTGKLLTEKPLAKAAQVVWAADNKTIFYVTEDEAKRPHKLWRHEIGSDKHDMIYEEKDELYTLALQRTRDDKFIVLQSNSSDTDEFQVIPADRPTTALKVVFPRQKLRECSLDHRNGHFYLCTNQDAKNYRIVMAPDDDLSPSKWREVVPHRPNVFLDGLMLLADYMIVREREGGVPQVAVYDLKAGGSHRISFPEANYSVFPSDNPDFNTKILRFNYQSFITPNSVFDYDLNSRERKLLKETEVLGGYDRTKYTTERLEATATDGTKVPISLVRRKDVPLDGKAPALLVGYGAYGASADVNFSSPHLSLVDRGVVIAEAHIRGGKDLGQDWYDHGKMMHKRNTFTDFIDCADHLVKSKYCDRNRLVIQGGSAGGLLMGAVLNFRPDVCKAAIVDVPFVDVITTMLDETIPLTVQEFLEWGNPKIKSEYEYLKSYCPYTNIKKANYPAMLVTTSINDSQVLFHEPTKYVAKMRMLRTDKNPLVYRCIMAAGHGGSSGRYDNLREQAYRFAFALDQMGIHQ